VDALQDQDAVLQFHFTGDVTHQPSTAGINAARLQRAPEGSGQSAAGGGHDIIQGGGARREIRR
jgi:hypothetical protein